MKTYRFYDTTDGKWDPVLEVQAENRVMAAHKMYSIVGEIYCQKNNIQMIDVAEHEEAIQDKIYADCVGDDFDY